MKIKDNPNLSGIGTLAPVAETGFQIDRVQDRGTFLSVISENIGE